ncbi:hypothetical protein GGP41_004197 [Bipolaris sorokiniana]|uniref:Uncharacterized protein n=1 Tax=Cochliobolus sativus TaxID=45130 RepID=A0A8H5ZNP4_COCSA|nr:hypothetical protein GGP41_004197 [Bipolaris sorokiniana]
MHKALASTTPSPIARTLQAATPDVPGLAHTSGHSVASIALPEADANLFIEISGLPVARGREMNRAA